MSPKITPTDVVEALGGVKRVARMMHTTDRAVYNWQNTKFPANTYVAMQTQLRKLELEVPDSLWAMRGLPGQKPRKPWKHKKRRGNGK